MICCETASLGRMCEHRGTAAVALLRDYQRRGRSAEEARVALIALLDRWEAERTCFAALETASPRGAGPGDGG